MWCPITMQKTCLERQRLVHPVVAFQDLLAVEPCHALGVGLGEPDQLRRADRAPASPQERRVTDEQVVFGAAEHLRGAGVALAGGAAVKLAVNASAAVGFG